MNQDITNQTSPSISDESLAMWGDHFARKNAHHKTHGYCGSFGCSCGNPVAPLVDAQTAPGSPAHLVKIAELVNHLSHERLEGRMTREDHAVRIFDIDAELTRVGFSWADVDAAIQR